MEGWILHKKWIGDYFACFNNLHSIHCLLLTACQSVFSRALPSDCTVNSFKRSQAWNVKVDRGEWGCVWVCKAGHNFHAQLYLLVYANVFSLIYYKSDFGSFTVSVFNKKKGRGNWKAQRVLNWESMLMSCPVSIIASISPQTHVLVNISQCFVVWHHHRRFTVI